MIWLIENKFKHIYLKNISIIKMKKSQRKKLREDLELIVHY